MELREGYKQTEVGVIPEDWDCLKLIDVAPLQRGIDLSSSELEFGGYPVVYSNGIMNYHSQFIAKGPGVVTGRSGTIGSVHFVHDNYWPHNTTLWVTDFKQNDPKFIYYLYHKVGLSRFRSGSGVPTLNRNDVHDFHVPVPPTRAEQEVVAGVLTDVDELISLLETLITKKRHIKQGTMQELLSGRKRLSGFERVTGYKKTNLGEIPKDWKVVPLLEVATCKHGKAHEQFISKNGEYEVVNSKFVSTEGKIKKHSYANFCKAKIGDILMVLSDLPNGKALAKCFLVEKENKYAVNQRVCIYRSISENSNYLFYLLNRNKFFLALDDGVTQTHILNGDIQRCEIFLPSTQNEQIAIAAILSEMQIEITTLEEKLAKTRLLKQGMMAELLTGRIRLV